MLTYIKKAFQTKSARVFMLACMLMMVGATAAFAAGEVADTATVDVIVSALKIIVLTALAAMAAIAAIAISLFGGIYAWRYAKQVFKVIAK